ncbi:MAG: flavodoxin [Gemmiger sp.]|nr:flavodoxin [Gemmiger sp.]
MKKIAIVYWSGTGNTQAMAELIAQGVTDAGGTAETFTAAEFDAATLANYDAIALGCPAMGAEQLEESEFEPLYNSLRGNLAGKPVGLFGSYGWGDGEWMRTWAEDCAAADITLVAEPVTAAAAPEGEAADACTALGAALAR